MRIRGSLGALLAVACVSVDGVLRLDPAFLVLASAHYYCAHGHWPRDAVAVREFAEEARVDSEGPDSDRAEPIQWDLFHGAAFGTGADGELVITPDPSGCGPFEATYERVTMAIPVCEPEVSTRVLFVGAPSQRPTARCD
jgi:hypothetical protein